MSLPALRQAVKSAATEQGEVAAVTRHLRDQHGFSKPYAVSTQQGADRRVVRIYVWRNTPMGHVALVAGPSMAGQAHVVEEVEGTVTPSDVDLFIPASGRSPALAAYKRGAAPAPVRANNQGRAVARAMVGEATWGGGYSPHSYRPNPRELSPGFASQIAESRQRATSRAGGPGGPGGPVGPTHGAARAPVFAWLYDAAGRRYRVQYRVIATQKDGMGPVLASNLPGSFTDAPAYPPAFQARSLSRMGEQQKIQRIAADMDPARYLLPHADPTFGAPVVWEGNGEAGTRPGVYYVLGGNSRTIAFLMASDAKIREYDAAAAELWPDIWPDEPAPRGYRYLVVRQAYPPSCPSLADARALNAACQMAFAQAQGLAGATQQSMAGRETPLGEAVSLVRGLGITGDIAEIVPSFNWSRGAVARDNVADFIADLDNRHFLDSLRGRLGAERFNGFVSDPDNAAKLINSVLIGFLPRGILDRGFGTEKEEQALLAALPALVTLRIAERQGKIPAGFDLLPHLEDARAFADGIKGMTVAQARSSIEAMRAQGSLNLRTRDGDIVRSLGDRIGPLGILLGLTIKRAEGLRDPSVGMDAVLIPYVAAALASPDRFKVAGDNAMFAAFAKPTMPKSYPVEVLGGAVARAIGGPEAEPIIPQTRAADRGETGGGAVVSVGSPSGGGGGGMFGSRPAAPAAPAPVEPPPLAAPARPAMFAAPAPASAGPKLNGDELVDILMDGGRNSADPGYDDFEGVVDQLRRAGMDRQAAEDLAYAGSQAWRKNMGSPYGAEDLIRVAVAGVVPGFGGGASRGAAAPASVGLFGGRAAPVEPAPLAAPAAARLTSQDTLSLPVDITNRLIDQSNLANMTGYRGLAQRNDLATRTQAEQEAELLKVALQMARKERDLLLPAGLVPLSQKLMREADAALLKMQARLTAANARQALVDDTSAAYARAIRDYRAALAETNSEEEVRSLEAKYDKVLYDIFNRLRRDRESLNERLPGQSVDPAPSLENAHQVAQGEVVNLTDDEIRRRFSAPEPAPAPAPDLGVVLDILLSLGTPGPDGEVRTTADMTRDLERFMVPFGLAKKLVNDADGFWEEYREPAKVEEKLREVLAYRFPSATLPPERYARLPEGKSVRTFLATLKALDRANAEKALDSGVSFNNRSTKYAALVNDLIEQGGKLGVVFGINKALNRSQYNRMDARQQDEWARSEVRRGPKQATGIYLGNNFTEVPKWVFRYAQHLGAPWGDVGLDSGFLGLRDTDAFARRAVTEYPDLFEAAVRDGARINAHFGVGGLPPEPPPEPAPTPPTPPTPAPALDLADELLRQAGLGPAAAPAAAAPAPLAPPPADESPLPAFVADRTGDLRDAWLALYRAARAYDRDAEDAPAQVVRMVGDLEQARTLFKLAREGHAGAFVPDQVEKAVKEVETARRDIADFAPDYTQPDDGNRPRKLYEPNAAKAAWEDAKEAAIRAAVVNLEPEARKAPLDVRTIGADLARLVLRLINDYVARWPDGPPTGGTRELASRRTWQNGRLVVDVDVLPVIREARDGFPPNIDLRLSEVVPERLLVPLNDAVLDALRRAKLGPTKARLQSTARVSARVLNRPNAGWPPEPPPPVAAPAPAAPLSKEDRMAALLRDKVSRANPYARRNPLAPWEHDARPIYRPLLSAPYRRNGGPVLDERVKGAIRQILAAKYGKTGADGEAVLATLLGAVSQLDASTPTDKLATVILGALADIVAIFDEDEGGEAGGEVVAFPGARSAPAPAATRLFYRPALNKQNTLLEYVDPQQNPTVEWATVPGEVQKTLQLSPSRWDQIARSLLTDRPGEFVGGVVGDLRDGGHLVLTEIKADGRPTFYVDSQGYDNARYVLFDADVPKEQARDQIRRTMTADLKTLISDVREVHDAQYQRAVDRGYEIPRWTFPQDAAERERLIQIEQKADGSYTASEGYGRRRGGPDYGFEFDLGSKGYYKTLTGALKFANAHLAGDKARMARLGNVYTVTAADVKPYTPPTGDRQTEAERAAWHAARDAEWANRHQRAAQPAPRTAAPAAPRTAAPVEPAPLAAPAAAPTVEALSAKPNITIYPSPNDGRYAAQVMSGGSPLSQAQPGPEGFERLLGVFAPGAQYARQGGRGDYALVNLGDRFEVMGVDDARAFLARQAAKPPAVEEPGATSLYQTALQKGREYLGASRSGQLLQVFDKMRADADYDLSVEKVLVPDVTRAFVEREIARFMNNARVARDRSAGEAISLRTRGQTDVTGADIDRAYEATRAYIEQKGREALEAWDRAHALRSPAPAPPAPTRTAADLPPEALEQIRVAMRAILAGLPA